MTVEEKNEALYNAVNSAWNDSFDGWEELDKSEDNPNVFILGEKYPENGFIFYLAGCRDLYGGWIWVEYEPEKDLVGVYIKDRPIQPKFKEDLSGRQYPLSLGCSQGSCLGCGRLLHCHGGTARPRLSSMPHLSDRQMQLGHRHATSRACQAAQS